MSQAHALSPPGDDFLHDLPLEAAIVAFAEARHGVVTTAELRAFGLGRSAVAARSRAGRLHRIHRGVYVVGRPALTREGRALAAVRACGQGALVSHRWAAALRALLRGHPREVEITVPGTSARPRAGMRTHASVTLTATDATLVANVPCTSVARTLVDLGDVVPPRVVERALEQAELLRLFDLRAIEDALERAGPRRGAGILRSLIHRYGTPALTESELEERFLELCRAAELPSPAVNAWITTADGTPMRIDFLWRAERLVVETDGHAVHATRSAFARDRRRDRLLKLAGYEVLRFTWREVVHEPEEVVAAVRGLLARLARP